jgi:hypothetical protein
MRAVGDMLDSIPGPAVEVGVRPTRLQRRLIEAGFDIRETPPDRIQFLHSVFCHVGLPRRKSHARVFERWSGHVGMRVEAGQWFDGTTDIDQPLPYGVIPRLVMIYLSTEAIRTRCRCIELGSIRGLLASLGLQTSGGVRGGYAALRTQLDALAACRMILSFQAQGEPSIVDTMPIERFEGWWRQGDVMPQTCTGKLELSEWFYNSLTEHAVPVDARALNAIRHSALSMDVYVWLAQRLCRVKSMRGTMLSWHNLYSQFGQDYRNPKDFKRELRRAIRQVLVVYPDARVREVVGGIELYPSAPPIARRIRSLQPDPL